MGNGFSKPAQGSRAENGAKKTKAKGESDKKKDFTQHTGEQPPSKNSVSSPVDVERGSLEGSFTPPVSPSEIVVSPSLSDSKVEAVFPEQKARLPERERTALGCHKTLQEYEQEAKLKAAGLLFQEVPDFQALDLRQLIINPVETISDLAIRLRNLSRTIEQDGRYLSSWELNKPVVEEQKSLTALSSQPASSVVPKSDAKAQSVKAQLERLNYDERCEIASILKEMQQVHRARIAQKQQAHARWVQLRVARRLGAFNQTTKPKAEAPETKLSGGDLSITPVVLATPPKMDAKEVLYDKALYEQALLAHDRRQGWAKLSAQYNAGVKKTQMAPALIRQTSRYSDESIPERWKTLREQLPMWLGLDSSVSSDTMEQRLEAMIQFCETSNRFDECLVHLNHETELALGVLTRFKSTELKDNLGLVQAVCGLAAAQDKHITRTLLGILVDSLKKESLLNVALLEGIVQVMRTARPDAMELKDLITVLDQLIQCSDGISSSIPEEQVVSLLAAIGEVLSTMVLMGQQRLVQVQKGRTTQPKELKEEEKKSSAAQDSSLNRLLKWGQKKKAALLDKVHNAVDRSELPLLSIKDYKALCDKLTGTVIEGVQKRFQLNAETRLKNPQLYFSLAMIQQALIRLPRREQEPKDALIEGAKCFFEFLDSANNALTSFSVMALWDAGNLLVKFVEATPLGDKLKGYFAEEDERPQSWFEQFLIFKTLSEGERTQLLALEKQLVETNQWHVCLLQGAFVVLEKLAQSKIEPVRQAAIQFLKLSTYKEDGVYLWSWPESSETLRVYYDRQWKERYPNENSERAVGQQRFQQQKAKVTELEKRLLQDARRQCQESSLLFQYHDYCVQELQLTYGKSEEAQAWQKNAARYVPALAKSRLEEDDEAAGLFYPQFDGLMRNAKSAKQAQVLLILGDAGTGKSMFLRLDHLQNCMRYFGRQLSMAAKVPVLSFYLVLNQSEAQKPLEDYLSKHGFTEPQIRRLREGAEGYRLSVHLDGYDEWASEGGASPRLFNPKVLGAWKSVAPIVLVTCRSQYLQGKAEADYLEYFAPEVGGRTFQKRVIMRLDAGGVERLTQYYVETENERGAVDADWTQRAYLEQFEASQINELVRTPMILLMALKVLPILKPYQEKDKSEEKTQHLQREKVSRLAIYEEFTRQYIEEQRQKQLKSSKESLGGLTKAAEQYAQELALMFFAGDKVAVSYQPRSRFTDFLATADTSSDKAFRRFFESSNNNLLATVIPLQVTIQKNAREATQATQYSFIHKSILDYFVAKGLFAEVDSLINCLDAVFSLESEIPHEEAVSEGQVQEEKQEGSSFVKSLRESKNNYQLYYQLYRAEKHHQWHVNQKQRLSSSPWGKKAINGEQVVIDFMGELLEQTDHEWYTRKETLRSKRQSGSKENILLLSRAALSDKRKTLEPGDIVLVQEESDFHWDLFVVEEPGKLERLECATVPGLEKALRMIHKGPLLEMLPSDRDKIEGVLRDYQDCPPSKHFRDKLIQIMAASKENPELAQAAANAATVLSRLNKGKHGDFSELDFSGARLRGADFRGAILRRTNFNNADLRDTSFEWTCLEDANLSQAKVAGIRFQTTLESKASEPSSLPPHLVHAKSTSLNLSNLNMDKVVGLGLRDRDFLRAWKLSSLPLEEEYGETLLYSAVKDNKEREVKQLIDRKADVNQANEGGGTPLYIAAKTGHLGLVQLLLDKKADPHKVVSKAEIRKGATEDNITPLEIAVRTAAVKGSDGSRLKVIQALDRRRPGRGKPTTPVHIAARGINPSAMGVLKALLDSGSPVDEVQDDDDVTPLMLAAEAGHDEAVALLLEKKAVVDKPTKGGRTALHAAILNEKAKATELLLEHKANMNLKDAKGETGLQMAEKSEVIRLVLDAKAVAPLLKLVAEGEQDQAEALLKNRPNLTLIKGTVTDLSGRTFTNITALQYALWALDWHMWKMLLKYMDKAAAASQLAELEDRGTAHGKHANWQKLINALYACEPLAAIGRERLAGKQYDSLRWNWTDFFDHFIPQVGGAQKLLPVHVVNEYCQTGRTFEQIPDFKAEKLARTRVVRLYDDVRATSFESEWYTAKSGFYRNSSQGRYQEGLGTGYAYIRANNDGILSAHAYQQEPRAMAIPYVTEDSQVVLDALALQALKEVREQQLETLAAELGYTIPAPSIEQLLKHVAYGEQDEAEALIQKNPELLLAKGNVTDLSKREFKEITAFQYALWALDWHMWKMLLKYMGKEAAALQFAELEYRGTAHGKHFSIAPLLEALDTYVKNYNEHAGTWQTSAWDPSRYEKLANQWCSEVGGAQLLLPAHVAQEYCHPTRSFVPVPEFKEKDFVRSLQLYGEQGNWYTGVSYKGSVTPHLASYGLRESYGITRYNREKAAVWLRCGWLGGDVWLESLAEPVPKADAEAIRCLGEVRQQQLAELGLSLKEAQTQSSTSTVSNTSSSTAALLHSSNLSAPTQVKESKGEAKVEVVEGIEQLLKHVAYGEQQEAEALIQKKPQLLSDKGDVTDLSKREFKAISAFQYAVWALDWRMWEMLLKYMDKQDAALQLAELKKKGTAHGKNFSLESLIKALDTYVATYENSSDWCWDPREEHWCEKVGKCQLLLPANMAQEYCHPNRSFVPVPSFQEQEFPRSLKLYKNTGEWYTARHNGGGLGEKVAISRSKWRGVALTLTPSMSVVKEDVQAIQRLWGVRKQKLAKLDSSLTAAEVKSSAPARSSRPLAASTVLQGWNSEGMKEVNQLLQHVANGEQEEAENLIKKNPELLLCKGTVTDLSKREFKEMTAFQYALWALDWHMWTMLLKYLPVEEASTQYEELETHGTVHGKEVSWQPVVAAYDAWLKTTSDWSGVWCRDIGSAQLLLPAHAASEYLRPGRNMTPVPSFTESTRGGDAKRFYDNQLGTSGAWYRGEWSNPGITTDFYVEHPAGKSHADTGMQVLPDQEALSVLYTTRRQQKQTLKSDLIRQLAEQEAKSSAPTHSSRPLATSTVLQGWKWKNERIKSVILWHVVCGEQEEAESLIKKNPELLLYKGTVTDLSKREFKEITPFQYALWALDWHMWTMLLKYLSEEEALVQYKEFETLGTAHGKHYNLTPLLDALKVYVDNGEKWNGDQRAVDQWCKKVGSVQRLLPVHVVNEYCRADRPFDPCPSEWTSPLPRQRAVEVWNGSQWVKDEWFTPPKSSDALGSSFAFCRGPKGVGGVAARRVGADEVGEVWLVGTTGAAAADLVSLQALWSARTQQLKLLSDTLVAESQSTMISLGHSSSPLLANTFLKNPAVKAETKVIEQLPQHVANGEQEEAESLIKKKPELLETPKTELEPVVKPLDSAAQDEGAVSVVRR